MTPTLDQLLWAEHDARRNGRVRELEGTGVAPNTAYAAAALESEADAVRRSAAGKRNATLNIAAFSLGQIVAAGSLDTTTVVDTLTDAAYAAGLREPEVGKTIESGLRAGLELPRQIPEREPFPAIDAFDALAPTAGAERTSWWPRDLTAAGDLAEAPPSVLARNDGQLMFYAGKVNGLIGESESGKTWVALLAACQELTAGRGVVYLDFEDTAAGIVSRLRSLGVTGDTMTRLRYVSPDESLHAAAAADLRQTLADAQPSLVVLDGFNAAMTLLGLDLVSNTDATHFAQRLLRPLTATGAAVVTVDHVPKSKEARGKGGIGAQAKRAMTTGCALAVDVVTPFGRGMAGRLRLTVDKDRPGHVRAVSAGAKHAGTAALTSFPDGSTTLTVEAPDLRPASERGSFEPTHLMEKVSHFLQSLTTDGDGGVSGKAIEEGVGGNREYVRKAVGALVDRGHVRREAGPRGAILHALVTPYSEAGDDSW